MIELHYYFLQQSNNTKWDLKPASDNVIVSSKGGSVVHMATYDLKALTSWPINIRAVYKKKLFYGIIPQPILHATRYVGGKRCYSLTRRQITITKFDLILGKFCLFIAFFLWILSWKSQFEMCCLCNHFLMENHYTSYI